MEKEDIPRYFATIKERLESIEGLAISEPESLEDGRFNQLTQRIDSLQNVLQHQNQNEISSEQRKNFQTQKDPLLQSNLPNKIKEKKPIRFFPPYEALMKTFHQYESIGLHSELFGQLETSFLKDEKIFESHILQWALLLSNSNLSPSEGFINLITNFCSRSVHFTFLLKLQIDRISKSTTPIQEQFPRYPNSIPSQLQRQDLLIKLMEKVSYEKVIFQSINIFPGAVRDSLLDPQPTNQSYFELSGLSSLLSFKNKSNESLFKSSVLLSKGIAFVQGSISVTNTYLLFEPLIPSPSKLKLNYSEIQSIDIQYGLARNSMIINLLNETLYFSVTDLLHQNFIFHTIKRQWIEINKQVSEQPFLFSGFKNTFTTTLPCRSLINYSQDYIESSENMESNGCFARVCFDDLSSMEMGDQVIIPTSMYKELIRSNIPIPLILKIKKFSHLETNVIVNSTSLYVTVTPSPFVKTIYLPFWMMQFLKVSTGDKIDIETTSLEQNQKIQLQPIILDSNSTQDLKNSFDVNTLKNYQTLTLNSEIPLSIGNSVYYFRVASLHPSVDGVYLTSKEQIEIIEPLMKKEESLNLEVNASPTQISIPLNGRIHLKCSMPDDDLILHIKTKKEVEICLSTVNRNPTRLSCEWHGVATSNLTIEINRGDGFLLENNLYISFLSYVGQISPFVSIFTVGHLEENPEIIQKMITAKRSLFIDSQKSFLEDLVNISWKLRDVEETQRNTLLTCMINFLNDQIPIGVYIPLGLSSNLHHIVVRIPSEEACYFSTWDKVPVLLYLEVIDSEISCRIAHQGKFSITEKLMETQRLEKVKQILKEDEDEDKGDINSLENIEDSHENSIGSIFGESWIEKCQRVKKSSPFGSLPGWRLISVIIKANDDLVQEQFAMQIIDTFKEIWEEASLPLQLQTYQILAITSTSGIMETVTNATSLSTLKKKLKPEETLCKYFENYIGKGTKDLMVAQNNFVESVAATSLICYFLQVKDRHNANILIDREGRIVHIDYGWILDNKMPINLEFAPFKLTEEMVEVMGGINSPLYLRYRSLCVQGFLEARLKYERILSVFEIMEYSSLRCLSPTTSQTLRTRFQLNLSQREATTYIHNLIDQSRASWSTNIYDTFQKYYASIY